MRNFIRILVLIGLVSVGVLAKVGQCEEIRTQLVADMEGETDYKVVTGKEFAETKASIDMKNVSQGQRSLRIEYTAEGDKYTVVIFPVKGAKGFNTIAFDIYCEQDNGSTLVVDMWQEKEGKDKEGRVKTARWQANLDMSDFTDGWTSVRLAKDAELRFRGNVDPDWGKMRSVRFGHIGAKEGKCIFYLDNIRFEQRTAARKKEDIYRLVNNKTWNSLSYCRSPE